jgi:hypothetical protein
VCLSLFDLLFSSFFLDLHLQGDRYPTTLKTDTVRQVAVLKRKVLMTLTQKHPATLALLTRNTEQVALQLENQANSTMTNLTSSKKLSTILNAYNMSNLNEVDDGFIWRRFVRTHIVTPFSPKFCFWQILILLVTIFNTLYIPMAIAYYDFLEGQDLRFAVVSWIGDAILVLDCVFNASTVGPPSRHLTRSGVGRSS